MGAGPSSDQEGYPLFRVQNSVHKYEHTLEVQLPFLQTVLDNFQIVPRLMLPLSLAFDHRIVDGADAARFMNIVIEALENPENLVMLA